MPVLLNRWPSASTTSALRVRSARSASPWLRSAISRRCAWRRRASASSRQAIDRSNELGDADSADLFTEVSRGLDKSLWFLEAHLQAE